MDMPSNITIYKTIALVNALTRIRNFCIDEVDKGGPTWHDEELSWECRILKCRFESPNLVTWDMSATSRRHVADIFSNISKIYVGSTAQTTDICYRNVGCLQCRQHVGI